MKRLFIVLLDLLVLLDLSSGQTPAMPETNLVMTREVRFNFGGLQDWFLGLLPNGDHLMVSGAKQVYDPPAPQSLEAAIGKFTLTGQTEWVVIDSGFNGAEYSISAREQTAAIGNKTVMVVQDAVPNSNPVMLLLKLNQNGNILLKDTSRHAIGNPGIFITNWADTIVAVEQRNNGDVVLLDENFNLIRRFPMQTNGYGLMNPRVKGDTLWLSSNEAMFGTYIAQYNLRTGQQNWRFDTPDTDTIRSVRTKIEIDQENNVYCFGNKINYYIGGQRFFAYSLDPAGNLRWYREWFPTGNWRLNYGNWADCMAVSNSGIIALGGAVEHQRQPVDPNENDAYLVLLRADNGQLIEEQWWEYDEGARFNWNNDVAFVDGQLIALGYAGNGPQTTWTAGFLRFYDVITSVEQISDNIPEGFHLRQNYPNPFNPRTTIEFELPQRSFIKLTVLNILGQELETLVAEELSAGVHRTTWDAARFPSGIYFYRVEAKNFTATKKMLLVK